MVVDNTCSGALFEYLASMNIALIFIDLVPEAITFS